MEGAVEIKIVLDRNNKVDIDAADFFLSIFLLGLYQAIDKQVISVEFADSMFFRQRPMFKQFKRLGILKELLSILENSDELEILGLSTAGEPLQVAAQDFQEKCLLFIRNNFYPFEDIQQLSKRTDMPLIKEKLLRLREQCRASSLIFETGIEE